MFFISMRGVIMTIKQAFKFFPKDTIVKIFDTQQEKYIGMGTIECFKNMPTLNRLHVEMIIPAPDWDNTKAFKVITYFYVRKE